MIRNTCRYQPDFGRAAACSEGVRGQWYHGTGGVVPGTTFCKDGGTITIPSMDLFGNPRTNSNF